jgi:RES domain-containing protein
MVIPTCAIEGIFWRFVRPDYIDAPFSGAGAAKMGARFNRKDQRTLYLSCDANTASLEFKGGRPKAQEHYIFRVHYFLQGIVDLTHQDTRKALGASLDDIHAPWRGVLNPTADRCGRHKISLRCLRR